MPRGVIESIAQVDFSSELSGDSAKCPSKLTVERLGFEGQVLESQGLNADS